MCVCEFGGTFELACMVGGFVDVFVRGRLVIALDRAAVAALLGKNVYVYKCNKLSVNRKSVDMVVSLYKN